MCALVYGLWRVVLHAWKCACILLVCVCEFVLVYFCVWFLVFICCVHVCVCLQHACVLCLCRWYYSYWLSTTSSNNSPIQLFMYASSVCCIYAQTVGLTSYDRPRQLIQYLSSSPVLSICAVRWVHCLTADASYTKKQSFLNLLPTCLQVLVVAAVEHPLQRENCYECLRNILSLSPSDYDDSGARTHLQASTDSYTVCFILLLFLRFNILVFQSYVFHLRLINVLCDNDIYYVLRYFQRFVSYIG
jgi:hypothetical protein